MTTSRHGFDPHGHTFPVNAPSPAASTVPAWRRDTPGESRWPVAIAIIVVILLQGLAFPDALTLASRWLLPLLELLVLLGLIIAKPQRLEKRSRAYRAGSLVLIGMLSVANGWAAALLVVGLVKGHFGDDAGPLLITGGAVWVTNVIAFAIWYWELDRGGPIARAHAVDLEPDFLFAQMTMDDPHLRDWEPRFLDYLYLSFTSSTAFSPTDTLPLSRWTKMLMMVQELVSLITVALVIARAVNVLK